jgi:hypothetical protein
MPRFYFDVREGGSFVADDEGEELPDISAAEREAALCAAHLTKERLTAASRSLAVEVRDERGEPVVRAKVSLDIERIFSTATPPADDN